MKSRNERDRLRDEAFSRLFDEHWAAVRHHVEGVVADHAEVTEIVSEVFLVVWWRLDPERPMSRVRLLRIAGRVLRSRSAAARRATSGAAASVHRHVCAADAEEQPAGRDRVVSALESLSSAERRIIMLTYWDGLSVGEIAELLRRPRIRVRRMLHRAEDGLRTELGLEGSGDDDA